MGGSTTFTPAPAPIPIPIRMTFAITILLLVFLLSFRLLLLASSNDQNLLDVCSYAPEAEGSEFQDAEARVKANLSKVPAAP